jgi:hypothetical protein
LAWGYVDHPPLIVFIAWIVRHTLGTSPPALIFCPALAGAGRILLTGAFARQLGAKSFGTALAALLAAVPGIRLRRGLFPQLQRKLLSRILFLRLRRGGSWEPRNAAETLTANKMSDFGPDWRVTQ